MSTANGNLSPKLREKEWKRIRPQIKEKFYQAGIISCEICGSGQFLSFAHRLKRRFITSVTELNVVALLCQIDHSFLDERAGHEEMFRVITEIRDRQPI